jgi:excisionase family DNA binding protein
MTIAPFSLQSAALKPSDIARRLEVEVSTVYRWIRGGELPAIEVAGAKYVLIPAYERFVERHKKGVTIEEQAERYIGSGFEEEHEDAFDPLEGLTLPIPVAGASAPRSAVATLVEPAIEDARERLKQQLDGFEARFHLASERVHRLYFVEHQHRVEGVPDEFVAQWAGAYAAYLNLSLVGAY